MISNAEAVTAAAAYVADNDDVFTAAYNDSQGKIPAMRGAASAGVRQVLRDAVAGRGRDQFGAVKLAATWLAGHEQYLRGAVEQGVRSGTLPRGTTTGQASRFLNDALGVRPQAPQAAPAPVRDEEADEEAPVNPLRDEFVNALAGKSGQVKITIEGSVEDMQELLGL